MVVKRVKANPWVFRPDPLTISLNAALESLQDIDDKHAVPSPSSVDDCRRRIAFIMSGEPKTERLRPQSLLAMEQGKHEEPIVEKLFEVTGSEITRRQIPLAANDMGLPNGGTADLEVILNEDKTLIEIKRMGMWRYIKFARDGVKVAAKNHYTQVQLYLRGGQWKRAHIIGLSADYSALTWYWNSIRKWPLETMPPPLWTERIEPDEEWLKRSQARAWEHYYNVGPELTPRDYNPYITNFPCNWCGWKERCLEIGT